MINAKEYNSFARIGTLPHRSYYIPFSEADKPSNVCGIIDRCSSSRFTSLDGEWLIKQHGNIDSVELDEVLTEKIPVPSCVQLHGYDQIQYINVRYPIPILYHTVPHDNPCWHYRRDFSLKKNENERYYLNFEGVDSAFYLYVNGSFKGYSQISHATSEFDITELVRDGENTLDVIVLKWCVSTYLECQDKFRFSGIFRNVYLLTRPEKHITDYRITTTLVENDGILKFKNESRLAISLSFMGKRTVVGAGKTAEITVKNVKKWTADNPELYTLTLTANGEKIIEKVGFRQVTIDGKVFKINGEAIKLKGVNRHDFNCKTGATVTVKNIADDIKIMKYLNVNAVRTSHYPNMPEFYQLCDKYGIYVMDEADLETHGAHAFWREFAEDLFIEPGITDRHTALVERDKNRPCVIIWSLGNESSFGKAFFPGVKYIRKRDDTRPVHYESLQQADPKYYYTKLVDMVSMMYPSTDGIQKWVLDNPKETRPFILCEYTHAMGNSCGDVAEYWKQIYANEQCMGGFVWEWADHGIKTKKGFLYGGDFGESEHDGNFCCDGLLTPDRKIKSAALEMRAVYGGKLSSEKKDIPLPEIKPSAKKVEFEVNEHTAELTSIKADGREILRTPVHFNVTRYTDNDRKLVDRWQRYKLGVSKPHVLSCEKLENGYSFKGVLAANCLTPFAEFEISYKTSGAALEIEVGYKLSDKVKTIPRFGIEFGTQKDSRSFSFVGFGPGESYIDKHVYCEYGFYESTADENYDRKYVRPQESGSHYASRYLSVKDQFTLTADKEFSFSVNPYTTAQLRDTRHDFELSENDFVNVCVDLAMRGVGSHSCGPELSAEYEIPYEYKNRFIFNF